MTLSASSMELSAVSSGMMLTGLILLCPLRIVDDDDHAVSRDGCIDLDTDGILRITPELLDVEMLFHPFNNIFKLSLYLHLRNRHFGNHCFATKIQYHEIF